MCVPCVRPFVSTWIQRFRGPRWTERNECNMLGANGNHDREIRGDVCDAVFFGGSCSEAPASGLIQGQLLRLKWARQGAVERLLKVVLLQSAVVRVAGSLVCGERRGSAAVQQSVLLQWLTGQVQCHQCL